MELGLIFKEGAEVLKRNYVLAVPSVIATFVVAILSLFILKKQEAMGALAVMGLFSMVLNYFAHGVTVAMAREAFEKGKTSLRTGIDIASALFYHFLSASVMLTIVISLGFVLLIVPGFVAMFFLMFVFPVILMQGLGPTDAMKNSYKLVRANLNDSLVLFLALGAMVFAIAFLNMMLSTVPFAGQFLSVVINGAFGGFSSTVLLRAYIVLSAKTAASA